MQARRLVIFGAAVVMLAACGGSDQAVPTTVATAPATAAPTTTVAPTTTALRETTAAPSTTAVPATPSTTAVPATTAAVAAAVGRPSDAEFEKILEALYDRNDALYADPSNAEIQLVCASGSDCENTKRDVIKNLLAGGERIIDTSPNDIASIDNVRDLGADPASGLRPDSYYEVTYTLVFDSDVIGLMVDGDGEVVYEMVPPDDLTETRIVVRNLTDEALPWRFVD